jgi:hypothetical protein
MKIILAAIEGKLITAHSSQLTASLHAIDSKKQVVLTAPVVV